MLLTILRVYPLHARLETVKNINFSSEGVLTSTNVTADERKVYDTVVDKSQDEMFETD